MTYSEKLKDPRWQKMRLRVFQEHKFRCAMCFDSTSTLHVHHKRYLSGREPWEYPLYYLTCLCENCHKAEYFNDKNTKRLISNLESAGFVVPDCCPACGDVSYANYRPRKYLCNTCAYIDDYDNPEETAKFLREIEEHFQNQNQS